jgi:predicted 2-oxoglutarate/Fe(II)-dependent dioxygenase YbiX
MKTYGGDAMYKEYFEAAKEILDITASTNPDDTKKTEKLIKYLKWQKEQHELFVKESLPLDIPQKVFSNKYPGFIYDKHIDFMSKYYYKSEDYCT